jgi:hypothetical protein
MSIGPVGPGGPYLPPARDTRLARRKASYDRAADEGEVLEESAGGDDYQAALLARFPPGSGPISWIARMVFQTYHSVLRPKLGRIVDMLA